MNTCTQKTKRQMIEKKSKPLKKEIEGQIENFEKKKTVLTFLKLNKVIISSLFRKKHVISLNIFFIIVHQ